MFDPALVKLLVLSLSMLGALRLFVILFLGDLQRGPAIGVIWRKAATMGFSHHNPKMDVASSRGSAPRAPAKTALTRPFRPGAPLIVQRSTINGNSNRTI